MELIESCSDVEDGNLIENVKIINIKYGKTKNGWCPSEQNFPEGMNSTDVMDTYFMKLEKDESVDVEITFQVADSAGNITSAKASLCHL